MNVKQFAKLLLAALPASLAPVLASAHGTFDVSATTRLTLTGISGSSQYIIRGEISQSADPTRTYKHQIGSATSDFIADYGFHGADIDNPVVGDYFQIEANAFGETEGGYADASNRIDATFLIQNLSDTDELILTFEYENSYSIATDFHGDVTASGRAWLNLHSHGATLTPSGFNQVNTADGSNSYLSVITATLAPGAGSGGHDVSVHTYQQVSGIATVPEAGSLAFSGLTCLVGVGGYLWRRRQARCN